MSKTYSTKPERGESFVANIRLRQSPNSNGLSWRPLSGKSIVALTSLRRLLQKYTVRFVGK